MTQPQSLYLMVGMVMVHMILEGRVKLELGCGEL